jgi:hypothetical protein
MKNIYKLNFKCFISNTIIHIKNERRKKCITFNLWEFLYKIKFVYFIFYVPKGYEVILIIFISRHTKTINKCLTIII